MANGLPEGFVLDQAQAAAPIGLPSGFVLDKPEKEEGFFPELLSGSQRIAATPELGTLPEFGPTPEGDTFKIALGLLSTFDPKAQQDIIKEQIPEAKFETTSDGSVIIEVPTEDGGTRRSVLNRPGFSPQDLSTATAQVLSFIGPARLASFGKGILQRVGIGGAAAGATEAALQETGVTLGRKERDLSDVGIATLTGGLAETVVPAIQAIKQSRQASKLGTISEDVIDVSESVRAAQEASEATKIPLFQAQQTVIPAQLEKQSFVAQLPAGAKKSIEGLKAQNKASGEAVEDFLGAIAPDDAVVTGADQVRTAAQGALEKAKNIRSEKASPFYKDSFIEGADVNLKPVRESIEASLDELPEAGDIAKNLTKVNNLIKGREGKAPSLKLLHNAKIEIDQMLNKFGEGSLGNTTKNVIKDVKNLLLEQMDEASPLYKQARQAFSDASPDVVKVQDSIIGKIADLSDTQLKQVTTKIFDPSNTVKNMQDAKKAISDISPDAWNSIVRKELENRIGSIKSIDDVGSIENLPGQLFRAIFPNDKKTKVLFSALDKEGKNNLKFLQTALKRASLGRPGGSQTAARLEIRKELEGGIFQSLRNAFRAPIQAFTSLGEEAAFDRKIRVLSESLFDPTWKAQMSKIRKLNPNSPAAARAFTQLFNDIEGSEPKEPAQGQP